MPLNASWELSSSHHVSVLMSPGSRDDYWQHLRIPLPEFASRASPKHYYAHHYAKYPEKKGVASKVQFFLGWIAGMSKMDCNISSVVGAGSSVPDFCRLAPLHLPRFVLPKEQEWASPIDEPLLHCYCRAIHS